jgi:hypothetical protein
MDRGLLRGGRSLVAKVIQVWAVHVVPLKLLAPTCLWKALSYENRAVKYMLEQYNNTLPPVNRYFDCQNLAAVMPMLSLVLYIQAQDSLTFYTIRG